MKVLVTGGSRGIGLAIAEIFLQHGADVAYCGKNEDRIQQSLQYLENKYPTSTIIAQVVDVTNRSEVQAFTQDVLSTWSSIDILVNNAGTYVPGNISEQSFEEVEQQMHTNFYSAFHVTQNVLPSMITYKKGHIFNVCSIASLQAYSGGGAYSVSKFALLGFNDNLREEMKQYGIKVTAVLPGAAYSDSWNGSGIPEDRIMSVDDVANSVYHATTLSPQAVVERIILRPQLGDL